MGSFDYTCALSELSISAGTPTLVIPLVELNLGLNGGANARFSPAFPPLEGIYDDYGFVENFKPKAFHHAMARSMGRVDAHDLMAAIGDRDQGPVTVQTFRGPHPLVFALVRKDAWDALTRLPAPFGYDEDSTGWELSQQACAEGATILSRAPAVLTRLADEIQVLDAEVKSGAYSRERLALMLLRTHLLEAVNKKGPFRRMFEHNLMQPLHDSDIFAGPSALQTLALDMPSAGCSVGDIEEGLELCAHTLLCGRHMNALRKIWLDRDSGGPQFGERALHWLWARELSRLASSDIDWNSANADVSGFKPAVEARRADRATMEALTLSAVSAAALSRPKPSL